MSACNVCGCDDYSENVWKPGKCTNCFHDHNEEPKAAEPEVEAEAEVTTSSTANESAERSHSRPQSYSRPPFRPPPAPEAGSGESTDDTGDDNAWAEGDEVPEVPKRPPGRPRVPPPRSPGGAQEGEDEDSDGSGGPPPIPRKPSVLRKQIAASSSPEEQGKRPPAKQPPPRPPRQPSTTSGQGNGNTNEMGEGDEDEMQSSSTSTTSTSSSSSASSSSTGEEAGSSSGGGEAPIWDTVIPMDFEVFDKKRDKIGYELLTTEQSYVRSLNVMVAGFLTPLMERLNGKKVITQEQIDTIFGNTTALLSVNELLLKGLVERFEEWSNEQCLGDVVLEMTPFLKMYKMYANGHDAARAMVDKLESSNSAFRNFLAECATDPQFRGLDLRSYLIMPIQRVPRYVMLLQDYLKNTEEDHPDYADLSRALEEMRDVATSINESIRQRENRDKIIEIQNRCMGNVTLVQPSRVFIKEGDMLKLSRKKNQVRRFILFNDMLIYGDVVSGDKINISKELKTMKMNIQNVEDNDVVQNSFNILADQKSFGVMCESPSEKAEWLNAFEQAVGQQKKLRQTMALDSGLGLDEDVAAPVWVQDNQVKVCQACNTTKFTLVKRRHHCRNCGKVVCDPCSKNRQVLPHQEGPQRVCDGCFYLITSAKYSQQRKQETAASGNSIQVLEDSEEEEDIDFAP